MAKNNDSNRIFTVHGPFRVPCEVGSGGKYIPVDCSHFWTEEAVNLAHRKGCYLFALRAGKGIRPIYVGMTQESFENECFTHHKLAQHYAPALAKTAKGTPIMFLLAIDKKKGPPNKKLIKDLETFLIQVGVAKNPELSNIQNRKEAKWGIRGVLRGGKGKVNSAATEFRKAMSI
jgi:hypothetical protein